MAINYIILGIIQGILEWIPISSEGIVALASQFLIQKLNPVDISLFLHLGTVLAVLIYFLKDWIEVLTGKNRPLLRFLIIATLVSLAIGYPLYKIIKNIAVGSILLVIMGFGLIATSYFQKSNKKIKIKPDRLAIFSGFLQGLSVIPGLSRSGSTIFGLSLSDFSLEDILKISYMMSVPVVLASNGYIFLENPTLTFNAWPGLISSFIVGIFTLHFLINFAKKINFSKFTLVFGILCLLGAAIEFCL